MVFSINFAQQKQQILDLCIQVQQIAAPTGAESQRAHWIADHLRQSGYANVTMDALDNVYACLPGAAPKPALLVSAHTDTVFPATTDLSIRNEYGKRRVYGPGLGDNSTGVAALLWLAEQMRGLPPPPADIWFVANTGEEGNGDLRGMRGAIERLGDVLGAAIVIEGMGLARVVHRALGSRRYRIKVSAPGGHSWSDFGSPSAIHVLVQIAADISRLEAPAAPRTSFNVGVISGGTSINTIAQYAEFDLDVRSETAAGLAAMLERVQAILDQYTTPRWQQAGVHVAVNVIGDRPSGGIEEDHPLVQAAQRSLQAVGIVPQPGMPISSTDANIPLSRGIPAVCIGVTDGGNAHRLDEWITPELLPKGLQHLLTLTWWTTEWLGQQILIATHMGNKSAMIEFAPRVPVDLSPEVDRPNPDMTNFYGFERINDHQQSTCLNRTNYTNCATARPTSWPRPCWNSTRRPRSQSAPPSIPASTTISTWARTKQASCVRSLRKIYRPSRSGCARLSAAGIHLPIARSLLTKPAISFTISPTSWN